MPARFIIDRKERIAATYIGLVDRSVIETNVKAVLCQRIMLPIPESCAYTSAGFHGQ